MRRFGHRDILATFPRITRRDGSVDEEAGSGSFTVALDAASGREVHVDYATADGSAAAGSDYTVASGTPAFAPGERSKTVTVDIFDDSLVEGSEDFTLALANPVNATVGTGTATLTITDNEAAVSNDATLSRLALTRITPD